MPPIARLPAAVRNRNDQCVIGLDGIEHGVWEDADNTSRHVLLEGTPARRSLRDATKRRLHASDEPKLETNLTTSVVTRRVFILVEGLRMKLIPHRATARLTRARASSLGMVLTQPLRTSSRRRKASAAQSWRMRPSSAGSRLSTRRSARSARASLGRASASSAICSTVMLIPKAYRLLHKTSTPDTASLAATISALLAEMTPLSICFVVGYGIDATGKKRFSPFTNPLIP